MAKNNDELIHWKELARLEPNQAVSEFVRLGSKAADGYVQTLGVSFFSEWILGLSSDNGSAVLRNLSDSLQQQILAGFPAEKLAPLKELLSYAPGTAGALMAIRIPM